MTGDEIEAIADVVQQTVDRIIAQRMEEVYGNIETMRQEVRDAVEQIRDTAQVLHDNDVTVMAELARVRGDGGREYVEQVAESWRRFVVHEAEQLGFRVMVPKGGQ